MKKILINLMLLICFNSLSVLAAQDTESVAISFNIPVIVDISTYAGDLNMPSLSDVTLSDLSSHEIQWITTGQLAVTSNEQWSISIKSTSVSDYFSTSGGSNPNTTKALSDLSVSLDNGSNFVSIDDTDATTPVNLLTNQASGDTYISSPIRYKVILDPSTDSSGTYSIDLTYTVTTN